MCWNQIDEKLDRHEYWDVDAMRVRHSYIHVVIAFSISQQADVQLVLDNALLYNKKDTTIYRLATRMKPQSDNILNQLGHLKLNPLPPGVGELEPALEILELLFKQQDIAEDLPHILNDEPIKSLFAYEFEIPKPTPPPKPKTQRPSKKKKEKRDYPAERARRAARLAEEGKTKATPRPDPVLVLGASVSTEFGPRRTRGAAAKHAAFVSEALVGDQAAAGVPTSPTRRRQGDLPGQSSDPPVVESVDNQQSFKLFKSGWILPPTARRSGRVPPSPIEKPDGPPPRKRQRTGKFDYAIWLLSFLTRIVPTSREKRS